MTYDSWAVSWAEEDKEREFILLLRDSSLAPGARGWQWTSELMSEEKLRQELAKMNVLNEKADADIAKARTMFSLHIAGD